MKDYKDTLYMGKTSFEMRGNLNNKEPLIQKKWAELDLYNERIRNYRKQWRLPKTLYNH